MISSLLLTGSCVLCVSRDECDVSTACQLMTDTSLAARCIDISNSQYTRDVTRNKLSVRLHCQCQFQSSVKFSICSASQLFDVELHGGMCVRNVSNVPMTLND